MKQKNLIEISEDMKVALVLVHKASGHVDFAVAKGTPSLLDMMTLLFGVFTSMVKSLDGIQVDKESGGEKVRSMLKRHSLEECRDILAITANVFNVMANGGTENE